MANTNDVIIIDVENFPKVAEWGVYLDGHMGLEYYHLPEEHWQFIPQHITHLRVSSTEAIFGSRYWGEIRGERSGYGETEEGTTLKEKVAVDSTIVTKYTLPFMQKVIRMKIQEIFEHRYNTLRTNHSLLEDATWDDQLAESKAYLSDSETETKLIHRLAELRGLTTEEFATKVVAKQNEWKEKLFDLAVQEQSLTAKVKATKTVRDVNVFLEDYFGIPMPEQQCLEYNRCIRNDETGVVSRKESFVYGIKF